VTFTLEKLEDYLLLAWAIIDDCSHLLILSGPLGAGKTTLTQAIAKVLESDAVVSSPTYTLIHEYPTPQGLLVHIDAYRLPSVEALLGLGLEDYLERARLVVVEWGEGLLEHFPEATQVKLDFQETGRTAQLIRHFA
jgi:tRNA threonylcarbamoyladenosine biosynthesis protein TsaE